LCPFCANRADTPGPEFVGISREGGARSPAGTPRDADPPSRIENDAQPYRKRRTFAERSVPRAGGPGPGPGGRNGPGGYTPGGRRRAAAPAAAHPGGRRRAAAPAPAAAHPGGRPRPRAGSPRAAAHPGGRRRAPGGRPRPRRAHPGGRAAGPGPGPKPGGFLYSALRALAYRKRRKNYAVCYLDFSARRSDECARRAGNPPGGPGGREKPPPEGGAP
jgi:translation initiation factor IF-2